MQISDELRQSVMQSLPELDEIRDDALRHKVIDAWAYSLGQSSFTSIDEIPASGNPDSPPMTMGTQTDHIRGVARLAMGMGDALVGQLPHLPINRDLLVACALCHDVGKPYEFDPQNQRRWRDNPATSGLPAIRHPQYGTHACLTVGLPEEVCHAAGCHSGEGELVQRSLHVTIVHHADYVFWASLRVSGQLGT
jgi:23S rRNA maturation-related 3'-5' exoribonuclease YhaM